MQVAGVWTLDKIKNFFCFRKIKNVLPSSWVPRYVNSLSSNGLESPYEFWWLVTGGGEREESWKSHSDWLISSNRRSLWIILAAPSVWQKTDLRVLHGKKGSKKFLLGLKWAQIFWALSLLGRVTLSSGWGHASRNRYFKPDDKSGYNINFLFFTKICARATYDE